MVNVPSWFIAIPLLTGIIPLSFLVMFMLKQNKDMMLPQYLFMLPIVMFLVPMLFLIMYLVGAYFPVILLPLFTGIVPVLFLIKHIMDIKTFAPEAETFKKARLLRNKGKFGDVIMVCEGNDIAKFGCLETDPKSGKIVYRTKSYGIKINPSEYPNIPCMKTVDGVRIVVLSPLQITPVNGEAATAVTELMSYVRENYPKFNHLSDLSLATILTTQGTDLEEDAHLYLNESDSDLTELDIIEAVKEIQNDTTRELEVYPAHRFILFRKFMECVNCAYVGSFLKDFELTVRALTLEQMDRSKEARILLYAAFIAVVMIAGSLAVMILRKV
jgi:hypothetical protein